MDYYDCLRKKFQNLSYLSSQLSMTHMDSWNNRITEEKWNNSIQGRRAIRGEHLRKDFSRFEFDIVKMRLLQIDRSAIKKKLL